MCTRLLWPASKCTEEASYRANFGPLNNISTAKVFEDDPE
jgi:hypothetical protein